MALSIGVSHGSQIKVGDSTIKVVDSSRHLVTLRVDDGPLQVVSDVERTEILPNVFVFLGASAQAGACVRLAFEAPRSIQIDRVRRESFV